MKGTYCCVVCVVIVRMHSYLCIRYTECGDDDDDGRFATVSSNAAETRGENSLLETERLRAADRRRLTDPPGTDPFLSGTGYKRYRNDAMAAPATMAVAQTNHIIDSITHRTYLYTLHRVASPPHTKQPSPCLC
jgi:hypothetical protein